MQKNTGKQRTEHNLRSQREKRRPTPLQIRGIDNLTLINNSKEREQGSIFPNPEGVALCNRAQRSRAPKERLVSILRVAKSGRRKDDDNTISEREARFIAATRLTVLPSLPILSVQPLCQLHALEKEEKEKENQERLVQHHPSFNPSVGNATTNQDSINDNKRKNQKQEGVMDQQFKKAKTNQERQKRKADEPASWQGK